MGLFSNKKRPCSVCGNATPRLFYDTVEGMPICKECERKKNLLPSEVLQGMKMDAFRQYIAFYQENLPLGNQFKETFSWSDAIYMDVPKKLFQLRISRKARTLVMEASCVKSFRIMEGDNVLFESSPEGLRCYETDVPARVQAAAPVISQFYIQYEQYQQMKRMRESMEKNGDDGKDLPRIDEPRFQYPIIQKGFVLELTLEHPYWGGTRSWYAPGVEFDKTYPRIEVFLREFDQQMNEMHELAVNLMSYIGLDAAEIRVTPNASVRGGGADISAVDPVVEIQKYKGLLDSGAITEEEFAAKKRQLLGI